MSKKSDTDDKCTPPKHHKSRLGVIPKFVIGVFAKIYAGYRLIVKVIQFIEELIG